MLGGKTVCSLIAQHQPDGPFNIKVRDSIKCFGLLTFINCHQGQVLNPHNVKCKFKQNMRVKTILHQNGTIFGMVMISFGHLGHY